MATAKAQRLSHTWKFRWKPVAEMECAWGKMMNDEEEKGRDQIMEGL